MLQPEKISFSFQITLVLTVYPARSGGLLEDFSVGFVAGFSAGFSAGGPAPVSFCGGLLIGFLLDGLALLVGAL